MVPRLPGAVLFDLDGTLIDSEGLCARAVAEWAAHVGGGLVVPGIEQLSGVSNPDIVASLLAQHGRLAGREAIEAGCRWLDHRIAASLRDDLVLRPGAVELLEGVRAGGIPTALVTSTNRGVTDVALDRIGRHLFDATVCGDEVSNLKPHPAPYRKACRALGVAPARCVAIEDSPAGAESAERAGCQVLVVPNGVAVPATHGRVFADSLLHVDLALLASLTAR